MILKNLSCQREYYEFVVESGGVVEKAEAQYQAMLELESDSFNIGKQMLKWAIYDDSDQTDIQVRKFGFQNTKAWFKKAVNNFDAELQEGFPMQYKLRIDDWEGISNGKDHPEQVESMTNYFENNKFQKCLLIHLTFLLSSFYCFCGFSLRTPFSLIVTALAAGFVYRVMQAIKAYPQRVQTAINNLHNCMGEYN